MFDRPSQKKRVLVFYITYFLNAGGDQGILRLLQAIRSERYQPILITQSECPLTRAVQSLGIKYHVLTFSKSLDIYEHRLLQVSVWHKIKTFIHLLSYNFKVYRIARAENIDSIILPSLRCVMTLYPLVIFMKVPIIWNIWIEKPAKGLLRILHDLALRAAGRVVLEYNTQALKIFTERQALGFTRKFRVIYTGRNLDLYKVSPLSKGKVLSQIFNVGVVHPRKAQLDFIEMAGRLVKRYKNLKFYIVGTPLLEEGKNYFRQLKVRIKELQLEDTLVLLGWVDNVTTLLKTADLLVSTSVDEGLPGVVREAMAMAKPVVATDAGGASEAVKHDVTGLIVPIGDIEALVEAVGFMIDHPDRAREMGLAARLRMEEFFSQESYRTKYQKLLDELLGAD